LAKFEDFMKVDILAVGAHPDDIELSSSGTIMRQISLGYSVVALDLTKGQLGSRGSAELRMKEAEASAKLMGLVDRRQLDMADGFFINDESHILKLIPYIRHFRPQIVLANAPSDRHPDHGRAAALVRDACFYSGLKKIQTEWQGVAQVHWRPAALYHYIQDQYLEPDFVVDITEWIEKKKAAILCFESQFYNPNSPEDETPISQKNFLDSIFGKNAVFGRSIGVDFAEGFICDRTPGISDLFHMI
jgi:N-acetylglucosamine malate deacetylase 1